MKESVHLFFQLKFVITTLFFISYFDVKFSPFYGFPKDKPKFLHS